MEYDAKERCCGWCYGTGATMKCAKCPRAYCSRECQVRDWKAGRHKTWCGRAGEKCVDYEVRDAGAKGLGLFARRDFQRGEKILVERAVATQPGPGRPVDWRQLENTETRRATLALAPAGSSDLDEIFLQNAAELGDEDDDAGSGLFVNFSRANHDCLGNSAHYWDPDLGLKLLVANCHIPAGTEITFSYACKKNSLERVFAMSLRGFQCGCLACRTPDLAAKLDRALELDKKVAELTYHGRTEQAIRAGKNLLGLYDELQSSDRERVRTYYDLFQAAIAKKKTVAQGAKFIKEGHKCALRFYGREENEEVRKQARYASNPSLHRNYRCIN